MGGLPHSGWSAPNSVIPHLSQDSQFMTGSQPLQWPGARVHGLGWVPTSSTMTTSSAHGHELAATTGRLPFAWPSELANQPQLQPQLQENVTASGQPGPWMPNCSPMSTILPDALHEPMQHAQPVATPCEGSPSFSHYSNTSWLSAITSPYARSDSHARGTPTIKQEEPMTPRVPDLHGIPPLEQSSSLTSHAPKYQYSQLREDHTARGTSSPSSSSSSAESSTGSDDFDVKPAVHQQRPTNRRAFSSDGTRLQEPEERRKRGFTKPENANCHCDQCGKLFQRSYNLKAHLETHDPHRSQPHPCHHHGCNKRFVRRTDLIRHVQSVRKTKQH